MFDRVRFVLVAPAHPGNIGAAARAVRVMGFSRLVLVAPGVADPRNDPEARALSVGGVDVLAAAPIHATLAEALDGVRCACAMTGYAREFGPPLRPLRAACASLADELAAPGGDVAFVFGGERNGLSNEDIERCSACVAIPADAGYGSLNLAQAVQVTAYEARLALLGECAHAVGTPFGEEPPADLASVDAMVEHLREALVALGYLDPAEPRRLMARLRRLFVRARPTASELDILRGMAAAAVRRKSERAGSKVRAGPAEDSAALAQDVPRRPLR